MPRNDTIHLGVDVGTSGVRGVAIDGNGAVVAQASAPLPPPAATAGGLRQDPELWWAAVASVIRAIGAAVPDHRIDSLAVDGTSGTLLVTDAQGTPLEPALPRRWPGCWCCRTASRMRATPCIRPTGSPRG
jgi:sugar (pentulose or hexulose) kinase